MVLYCRGSKQMMQTLSHRASPTRCTPRPRVALSESSSQEGREPPHARGGRAAASVAFDKTSILGLEGDTSDGFLFFFLQSQDKTFGLPRSGRAFIMTGHQLWRPSVPRPLVYWGCTVTCAVVWPGSSRRFERGNR